MSGRAILETTDGDRFAGDVDVFETVIVVVGHRARHHDDAIAGYALHPDRVRRAVWTLVEGPEGLPSRDGGRGMTETVTTWSPVNLEPVVAGG